MKELHTLRIPVEEALGIEPSKGNSLRYALVDMAWEQASISVAGFRELDDAGDVGETTVRLDGTDFVVTVHDLRG